MKILSLQYRLNWIALTSGLLGLFFCILWGLEALPQVGWTEFIWFLLPSIIPVLFCFIAWDNPLNGFQILVMASLLFATGFVMFFSIVYAPGLLTCILLVVVSIHSHSSSRKERRE